MEKNYNIYAIAESIYNTAADMDRDDREENKGKELELLEYALFEIELLSQGGNRDRCDSFKTLLSALSAIFETEI